MTTQSGTFPVSQSATGMPATNVYQGGVSNNQVTFFGVPVLPPGSNNAETIRTNSMLDYLVEN